MVTEQDIEFMRHAMELAARGRGWVNPNPLVGAVIVRDGRILAEGWHERYGGLHAERNAFENCKEDTAGATMYVTLEPCCHYGKTPPCTEAVIGHGIARVVVGLTDPNPLVAGKGIELLRGAGIEVETGVCEEELKRQNRVFLKYIRSRMPWVVMKTAMTLDGKITACSGDSKWVTDVPARMRVQELRRLYMGIMVGSGTAVTDNPMLNCRLEGNVRQPVRMVVDSGARIAMDSRLVTTARTGRVVVAHTDRALPEKLQKLSDCGVETLLCNGRDGHVDCADMLARLGSMGIDSILLEGGGQLNETFLRNGLIDEVYAFVAPKLIGGREAKTPVEGAGFARMAEAVELQEVEVETIGKDILIHGLIG